ncbi:hypothetical protein SVIO_028960 [Streptomyces violaceusniger]|uniref:Uncharacterized protein n=1 Tax=Streptomyces violaceusniger TaxID=68280 RepID=A0A4D4L2N7_STRVO|nr:hypothetical protein SVIO_028960 [Streptomyces violaceusniger]
MQHFNEALGLIKSAVDSHSSKAAYLHASFGAGKSHFMAVLHALLNQAPAARDKTDFDPVFAKNGWLQDGDRRFLMVPVHMLDAKSMEQRILSGYVKRIKELEPDASTPRVYRSDAMFRDLQSMRKRLGDEDVIKFLAGAAPAETTGEWGEFGPLSPGPPSCSMRPWPPRSWRSERSSTPLTRPPRGSCGPGSPRTRPRCCRATRSAPSSRTAASSASTGACR